MCMLCADSYKILHTCLKYIFFAKSIFRIIGLKFQFEFLSCISHYTEKSPKALICRITKDIFYQISVILSASTEVNLKWQQ